MYVIIYSNTLSARKPAISRDLLVTDVVGMPIKKIHDQLAISVIWFLLLICYFTWTIICQTSPIYVHYNFFSFLPLRIVHHRVVWNEWTFPLDQWSVCDWVVLSLYENNDWINNQLQYTHWVFSFLINNHRFNVWS